jgi:hypothetical protein
VTSRAESAGRKSCQDSQAVDGSRCHIVILPRTSEMPTVASGFKGSTMPRSPAAQGVDDGDLDLYARTVVNLASTDTEATLRGLTWDCVPTCLQGCACCRGRACHTM